MKTLFTGGAVIVSAALELPQGSVLVEDGVILEVVSGEATAEVIASADEIIDTTGRVLMPGFINAHNHLFQSMLRGLSTNRSLESSTAIWPVIPAWTPRTSNAPHSAVSRRICEAG